MEDPDLADDNLGVQGSSKDSVLPGKAKNTKSIIVDSRQIHPFGLTLILTLYR